MRHWLPPRSSCGSIHRNKTGALINAAVQMGAAAAQANETQCKELEDYAFGIGLVFQIVDDVLDVTSTAEQLGKPIGSDSENGKTTFVTLYGAEGAMELAKKLNNETCASLHAEFGEKSRFPGAAGKRAAGAPQLIRKNKKVELPCNLSMSVLTFNEILTVSLLSWFVAQVLKTIINFVLLGRFQLERMWGDGGMPSAHSATVTAMVIATARSEGIHSAIFAVAAVVAIITMHDAMGVRRETGEQAKVLNKMLEQWIEVTEKNNPFLQNMHLKEMVGHTPLQVMAGFALGILVGFLYPMGL